MNHIYFLSNTFLTLLKNLLYYFPFLITYLGKILFKDKMQEKNRPHRDIQKVFLLHFRPRR
jgi:hypothetical protein